MDIKLGQRVQARRIELGFDTQIDAAAAAGVGTTTWGLLEAKGIVPTTRRMRHKITQVLEWPPDALEEGKRNRPPAPIAPQADPSESLEAQVAELRRLSDRLDAQLSEILERLDAQPPTPPVRRKRAANN